MSNLPRNWLETEIGDIADVIGGGTPKASDESNFSESGKEIAWLTPADLSGYKDKYISHGKRDLSIRGLETSSAKLMPQGTLLFSSRAPIGYVAIAANKIATNQGFKSFVFTQDIDPLFAYYYLRSIRSIAESRGTGTTFTELSGAAAKKLPFVIAPLNEQIRIANKLDSLLAKVDAAQARLEKIPTLLKRFRQSVLAAATSGELTREWREESQLQWEPNSKHIKDVASNEKYSLGIGPFGSNLKVADYKDHGHPLIFVRDIRSNSFGGTKTVYVDDIKFDELYAHRAMPGDILITKMGDPPGDIAIYPVGRPEAVITADCVKLRVDEKIILKEFASLSLKSKYFQEQIKSITAGVAQQKVNLKRFKELEILVVSMPEQKEIIRRVESLFSLADTVEKQYNQAKKRTDRLTQSLLAKAFRGELVPQDPNDEPASELLKRIQAEREVQKPVKKTRRKKVAS